MGVVEGINYFFLHSDEDATIRIEAEINPFYSFPKNTIEKLPSLYSEPALIPRFLYNFRWNRKLYSSREIIAPEKKKYPEWFYYKGGRVNKKKISLEKQKRNQMVATRYLSLRDIVNPLYNEEDVLKEIDKLYYKPKDKNTLHRLVKILYAGTPGEERTIVQNLFTHEKEFAEFLQEKMFQIEILPLVHGNFLQEILIKMDERIIRHGWNIISPPVKNVIRRSVSKNKMESILSSPLLEPEKGESLVEKIEQLIYQRFSRKIYYEKGHYYAYRLTKTNDTSNPATGQEFGIPTVKEEIEFIDSSRFELASSKDCIELLGASNLNLFFLLKTRVEVIRFDILVNYRTWEFHEFFRLPSGIILRIPFYNTGRGVAGAGILPEKKEFEFYFSNWEFM